MRCSQQLATVSPSPAPENVSWAGFGKALGLSAGTALTAAAVAMYIDQFSNPACTVVGDCVPISTTMKGRHREVQAWCRLRVVSGVKALGCRQGGYEQTHM